MAAATSGARDGLTSVTRGTLVMMLGTLGFVAESFVSRVILVRYLTPTEWSQFSIALTVAGLLSALGTIGLPAAVARSLPFEPGDRERRTIVRSSVRVVLPASLAVSSFMVVLSLPIGTTFKAPLLAETFVFFAASVGLAILGALIASIFQGYEQVLPNALFVQVLNPSLFIVFLLAGLGLGPGGLTYPEALVAYLVSGVVAFVPLVLYARVKLPKLLPAGPSDPGISPKLIAFAMPLFVVAVLGFAVNNADSLVLAGLDRSAVGQYSADLSLARLIQVGVGSLAYIILPVTARFVRLGDTSSVQTTYATATKWMALTSLPLFLVFFFYPGHALAFVYGANYLGAPVPLQILVAGAFASTLVGPSTAVQVSFGQTRLLLYNTVVASAADLLLSVALVPGYGTTGAAIAWTVANALYPALSLAELAFLTGVHPFKGHYVVPMLATAVPVALILALLPVVPPLWTLPPIVIGIALLFVVVVFVSGSLDIGDRLLLEAVEGMLGRKVPVVRWLAGHLARGPVAGGGPGPPPLP